MKKAPTNCPTMNSRLAYDYVSKFYLKLLIQASNFQARYEKRFD